MNSKMTFGIGLSLLILLPLFILAYSLLVKPAHSQLGIANPAAVHCVEELHGKLHIVTAADGSQSGYCELPDKRICEEWALFRENICRPLPKTMSRQDVRD